MPELPEVETMRRGVLGIVGSCIRDVSRPACRLKPIAISPDFATLRNRAVGTQILEVGRIGKRVVVGLDSRDSIIFEPRMTGLVLIADPPNEEHLRLRLELDGGEVSALLFWDRRGLGSVHLVTADEFQERYGLQRLGPDALTLSWQALRDRLAASRRPVKVALLDQRAVAGIGNLYASEILHLAKVHPAQLCAELSVAQWKRICSAMLHVLEEAIRYEGSTLSDGTYRNALNESGGYQNHHRVYDREGERCTQCNRDSIVRVVQAQRSTFFCPRCQPASNDRAG